MNELFREIEDDIRQEKFDRLWQNFGKIMVGASIAVVLATIVIVTVQNGRQAQAMEQTGEFIKGMDRLNKGDYKTAIQAFAALSVDANSPYYGVAMLRKAQAESASGDKEAALKTYKALAAHGGAFGDLAAMPVGADTGTIVEPDKKSPFYYTQGEWAGWQLLAAGKKSQAATEFAALRDDPGAPFSLRQRMQEVAGAVSDKPIKDNK